MSKVICDVCGTTYPETAAQCPICGSAKNSPNQTAAATVSGEASSASYAYVKGGRFSKKNVRRRSRGGSTPTTAQRRSERGNSRTVQENNEPSNTGLVIVVVLLMIAIVMVLVYIGVKHLGTQEKPNPNENVGTGETTVQTGDTTPSSEVTPIPCTGLKLSHNIVELTVGDGFKLEVRELEPADTTDEVTYASGDPTIATVTQNGEVVMVGEGQTVITVTCGSVSATCSVKTPNSGTDEPTPGVFEFEFNTPFKDPTTGYGDTTLSAQGATWKAYKVSLNIDPSLITWVSDNPEICTVENGIVTAVGPGTTKIHAQYNGVTYTCMIRCSFSAAEVTGDCKLSHTDVTLPVGQSFTLKLKDSSGNAVSVTWTCEGGGVTIDGNKITGAIPGTWNVSTTYEGFIYNCIVRVPR